MRFHGLINHGSEIMRLSLSHFELCLQRQINLWLRAHYWDDRQKLNRTNRLMLNQTNNWKTDGVTAVQRPTATVIQKAEEGEADLHLKTNSKRLVTCLQIHTQGLKKKIFSFLSDINPPSTICQRLKQGRIRLQAPTSTETPVVNV